MFTNVVAITGRLGQDPELRFTPSGTAVLNLRIAINEAKKMEDGTYKSTVFWIGIQIWKEMAERLAERLSKGMLIEVTGRLKEKTWTKQDGAEVRELYVVANTVQGIKTAAAENNGTVGEAPEPEAVPEAPAAPPKPAAPKAPPKPAAPPKPPPKPAAEEENDLPF